MSPLPKLQSSEASQIIIDVEPIYAGTQIDFVSSTGDSQSIFFPDHCSQTIAIPLVLSKLEREKPGSKWDWRHKYRTEYGKKDLNDKSSYDLLSGTHWLYSSE